MADVIKDYLLDGELYVQLFSRDYQLPLGTVGGLLLRLHRLRALPDQLTSDQQITLEAAAGHIEEEMAHWAVQTMDKVQREIKTRLRNWHEFLLELERDPRRYTSEYPTQAEGRTILDLLAAYAGDEAPPEMDLELRAADVKLRDSVASGNFVWGDEMQPAFPPERFWWLYVHPRVITRR
jgi:hypothetical protein